MLQIQRNDARYSVRLVDTNLADDGNYTCLVSNELGTISRTFTVNIVGNTFLLYLVIIMIIIIVKFLYRRTVVYQTLVLPIVLYIRLRDMDNWTLLAFEVGRLFHV